MRPTRHRAIPEFGLPAGRYHNAPGCCVSRLTPPSSGKLIHVILDNYAAHKHPKVWAWLERHPRWTFHFTPTSCSWLNAVEGFFAVLTKRRLRRGSFSSLVDLQAAINRYLEQHNANPKPFIWTAEPDGIIEKVRRRYQASRSAH
ncbi:MAG: family transposase, partial [Arthrobacter sp.]|nr:family transposase [Arthrobacter sp.]